MADKTQNITVNYKFNTADLERASAILNRANQASNQLQQSGQKAGENITKGFNQGRQSIASMETQLARLKTQIQVSSDPRRVEQLSNQYKNLKTQIDAANKSAFETSKAIRQTDAASKSATQTFGGLFTAAKVLLIAEMVRETGELALNLATLKGNVEGVERAFNNRFANAPALLEKLRTATQGTVKDMELMQRTLSATNLGVDVGALPQLLEFATRRAKETGRSVDDLTDRIVRGIGLKSTRVLDDLGISALRLKNELGGVSLEAATVAQVTEAAGRIATQELDKMGKSAENSATKVGQMTVALEKLRVTAAKKFGGAGSFLADIGTQTAKGLEELLKLITGGFNELDREVLSSEASRTAAAIKEGQAYKALGQDRQKQNDFLQQEINTNVERIGRINDTIDALTNERKIIQDKNPYDKRVDQLGAQIRGYNGAKFAIQELIKFLVQYRDEVNKINEDDKATEPSGIISRKQKQIEELQERIRLTNDLNNLTRTVEDDRGNRLQVVGKLIKELEIAQAELADLQRAFTDKIDPKPFVIKIDEATNSLAKFGIQAQRIEESMLKFQENWKAVEPPADTVAKLDTFWSGFGDMWEENWRSLVADSVDFQANAINNMLDQEARALQSQIAQLKNHYQIQQELAGDNERAKSELRVREERETTELQRRMFDREKKIRRAQTVIDGAAAAIKAFVTAPNVYVAIAQAALIAATTVAQLRIIDKEQPRFAKGVIDLKGPGTGTSDSIPARLSKGESVMTAWETQHAGDVLREIRAKKLDNKSLREMKQGRPAIQSMSFDDSKIIKAINANKPPDVIQQSNIAYEVRQHSETMRRKQRAKSMNI